jgi:TldD protein
LSRVQDINVLKPVVTVDAVRPNRGIDAEFLNLPCQELADAALSAATAAGASYADLRVHRIVTEIIQLRDGELETAVLSRELGFAVRVIVAGTWGFASHAELAPDVAADTARRTPRGEQCRSPPPWPR